MALELYDPRPQPRAIAPVPQLPEGLLTRIQKFLSPRTSSARVPDIVSNLGPVGGFGVVNSSAVLSRVPSAATYREYARTPWVFSGINIRTDQLASAEWDIVPYDNEKRFAARQRDRLRELFSQPSAKLDSFQSFAKVVVSELLTLDAAPIEKVRYPNSGEIAELWPTRGDWIAIDERWDGADEDSPRYYFVPDGTVRATFKNEDMVYLVANQRANSALGISPMLVLQTVVESELQALEYNRRQVMGAAPDGALYIGDNAGGEEVQKLESKLQAEVFGQSAMAVIGGYQNPKFMPFRTSNRDMQFREWEDLLIRCIAIVLGLSPMDLGITFDVNRSTAEQQGANTEDRGLRPLLALFQNYMTREVVWDESFGGRSNNLAFAFKSLNLDETLTKAQINKVAMPGVGWKSINEARQVDGRAPIGDATAEDNVFNHVLIGTPKGILDLNTAQYLGEEHLAEIKSKSAVDLARVEAQTKPAAPENEPEQQASPDTDGAE